MVTDIIKVLVVDDEVEVCELMRDFLRKKNYCTFGASSAAEAIELVKNESPHIVLLDLRLGSDSGLELLRRIKETDRNIKVIMVTALDDKDTVEQAISLGAEEFITKPFTLKFLEDTLLTKVEKLIPKRK